jgi:hypothetical protein
MAPAPSLDYAAAAMVARRRCYACGRFYGADVVQRDPAWAPTRNGWRCGDCSRAWARHIRARARAPIAEAQPRWALATRTPEHPPFDECLECESALAAREILLAPGGLTRAERSEVAAAVLTSL